MTDELLVRTIGVICLLIFLLHLLNQKALTNYALKRGVVGADRSVKFAALLMLVCGVLCFLDEQAIYGCYGLAGFLTVVAFTIHKFWDEPPGDPRLVEGLHFLKNLMFAALLVIIALTLDA